MKTTNHDSMKVFSRNLKASKIKNVTCKNINIDIAQIPVLIACCKEMSLQLKDLKFESKLIIKNVKYRSTNKSDGFIIDHSFISSTNQEYKINTSIISNYENLSKSYSPSSTNDFNMKYGPEIHCLLNQLKEEIYKPNKNYEFMDSIISHLTEINIYNLTEQMIIDDISIEDMIKFNGVRWFEWEDKVIKCESCNSDLRDLKKGPPFTNSKFITSGSENWGLVVCTDCAEVLNYW